MRKIGRYFILTAEEYEEELRRERHDAARHSFDVGRACGVVEGIQKTVFKTLTVNELRRVFGLPEKPEYKGITVREKLRREVNPNERDNHAGG